MWAACVGCLLRAVWAQHILTSPLGERMWGASGAREGRTWQTPLRQLLEACSARQAARC